jgi:hypothetical protein
MTNRRIGWTAWAAGLLALAGSAAAEPASQQDIEDLKKLLLQQEQSIRELKSRIQELEAKPAAPAPAAGAPPAAVAAPAAPPSPAEDAIRKAQAESRKSPVADRRQFDDKQEAAARPGDYTLDPQYRGFLAIPNTPFMIKFNPKPRLDMTIDSQRSGDDFRFVQATIPLEGQPGHGGGEQFNMNGNGSQLRVDMRAPSVPGNFRFYYQNDFFGSDTKNFQYRLQHLYGQYYGVVAGYTYGVFEDPDAWPDTVDYEGPNSVVYARRPLVHYTMPLADDWNFTVGVEDPDIFVDLTGAPDANVRTRAPDTGFNIRWESADWGHVQFSTIVRSIGADGGGVAESDDVFGWGVNLATSLNVTERDTVQGMLVYGYGVAGMGNDPSFVNSDAALDMSGDLVALEYASLLAAATHKWTPRWRSTMVYGFANVANTGMQAGDAYDFTHYASANLVYQLFKRLSIGVEGLYGYREAKSGAHGDVFRLQVGLLYSLFD